MHFTALIIAALSALATALPTSTSTVASSFELRGDGRAATLFKHSDLGVVNDDSTFVPPNGYCTDISNIFGGFDGKVKSLSVEKGHLCRFYQEAGCGVNDFTGGGMVLEVGFKNKKDERRQLGRWEGKIESVFCQRL